MASMEMMAVSSFPPPMSRTTVPLTAPSVMERILPFNWFLALRRMRHTSLCGFYQKIEFCLHYTRRHAPGKMGAARSADPRGPLFFCRSRIFFCKEAGIGARRENKRYIKKYILKYISNRQEEMLMIPLTLQLDWLPNAQFAGILLAREAGWYKKEGIDLEIVPWRAYLNQVDVLRQQGNIVVSTDDNLLVKAAIQGEPVLALAAMLQYSGLAYMVQKERGIRRFEELRGKRIGIHTDGRTGIAVVLDHVGLSTDDVDVVEVGFEYDELLRTGELDAMQCLAMVEPIELTDRGFDLDLFVAKDLG